jgi:flavin-dependent dehydrogenase
MRRTDPLIVGGGPAGSAAAIHLLRAGATPTIIERQRETGDALCGGFLSWRTLERLETLGLATSDLGGHGVTALRLFIGHRVQELALPGTAIAVSRQRLDSLLLGRAEHMGATVRRGIAALEYGAGGLRLEHVSPTLNRSSRAKSRDVDSAKRVSTALDTNGDSIRPRQAPEGNEFLPCDSLFLATGKHDLRGIARPRNAAGENPMLGLRLRLPPSDRLAALLAGHIEMHLFKGGYLGIVLQEDGSANACMAVHKSRLAAAEGDPAALFGQLAQDSPALADRLADMPAAPKIDAIGRVPYGWRASAAPPGVFRLGDQAGVIPSFAGEGIGLALASAECAVGHWKEGGGGAAPGYQRAFARRLRRPLAVAGVLASVSDRPGLALLAGIPGLARLIAQMTRV